VRWWEHLKYYSPPVTPSTSLDILGVIPVITDGQAGTIPCQ